jgi:hypothetical protein
MISVFHIELGTLPQSLWHVVTCQIEINFRFKLHHLSGSSDSYIIIPCMAAYLSVIRIVYIGDVLWAFKCLNHHQPPQCIKSHGHLLCVMCVLLYEYIIIIIINGATAQSRALASLASYVTVRYYTMWGYQLHDQPASLVILILPPETSSGETTRDTV